MFAGTDFRAVSNSDISCSDCLRSSVASAGDEHSIPSDDRRGVGALSLKEKQ